MNRFVCVGCTEYRRPRATVRSMGGVMKDGQSARDHSWIIRDQARVITPGDRELLYKFLLEPRAPFCLALRINGPNHLHLAVVNRPPKLNDRTQLDFTIDNVLHQYNVYELYLGLENGDVGREPGVRALIRLLGPCDGVPRLEEPKKQRVKRVKLPEGEVITKAEILPDHPDDIPPEAGDGSVQNG